MPALRSLDGLDNGTDLSVMHGRTAQHWQLQDRCLHRPDVGIDLPVELFSGFVAEGLVYLRDTAPPRVGEWFVSPSGMVAAVMDASGEDPTVVEAALLTGSGGFRFFDRLLIEELAGRWTRTEPPPWAQGTVVFHLLVDLRDATNEVKRHEGAVRKLRLVGAEVDRIDTALLRVKARLNGD